MGSFTSITPKSTKDQWKKTGTGGTFTDLATGKVITKDPVPKSGPGQTPADKTAGDGLTGGAGAAKAPSAGQGTMAAKAKKQSAGTVNRTSSVWTTTGAGVRNAAPRSASAAELQYRQALAEMEKNTPPPARPTVKRPTAAPSLHVSGSYAQLQNQARQAAADLDTEALNRANAAMKQRRAAAGKQTLGDRVSDVLSAVFSGSGAAYTNLTGFVYNAYNDPESLRMSIEQSRRALASGQTSDGKPINGAQRKTIQDAIAGMQARIAELEAPDSLTNRIYSVVDRMHRDSAQFQNQARRGLGGLGSTLVDAGVSMGQSTLDNALGALTGTGMAPFALRAFGGAAQEARQGGASLDEQLIYGSAQAAKEYVTEKLFGLTGPQRLAGGGSFDEAIEAGIRNVTERLSRTPAGQKILGGVLTWLASGATEGAEEAIGSVIENTLINPYLRDWSPDSRTVQEKFEEGLYETLVGAVSGLMGGVTNLGAYQVNPYSLRDGPGNGPGGTETGTEEGTGPSGGTDTTGGTSTATEASEARQRQEVGNQLLDLMRQVQRQREAEQQKAAPADPLMEAARRGGRLDRQAEAEMRTNPYTDEEAGRIRREGKTFRNIIAGIDTSVSEFFNKWRHGRSVQKGEKLEKLYLGKMSLDTLQKVENLLGYDIDSRDFIVTNDDVKHILDHHGDAKVEVEKGNAPLTQAIIDALPDIVANPDSIELGKTEKRSPFRQGIVFKKTLPDGTAVYIQFDNSGRGTFEGRTLYVKKGESTPSALPAFEKTDSFTSETTEPVLSPDGEMTSPRIDSTIAQGAEYVNKKDVLLDDGGPGTKPLSAGVSSSTSSEGASSPSADSTIAQGAENVNPGDVMTRELQRLFGGKRLDPAALTVEQMAAAEAANNAGAVGMDADNRLYQVNPEEHIDRRRAEDMGDRKIPAFQFDHPQLHPYYAQAARALLDELSITQKGGETIRTGPGYYDFARLKRSTSPEIETLLDEYGLSYGQIEKALRAIVEDHGQENFAAAKRVELVLDRMLSEGYTSSVDGPVEANVNYIAEKGRIAGSLDGGASLTEAAARDTIQETAEGEHLYEQRARENQNVRQEDHGAFITRSRQEGLRTIQSGRTAYGIRRAVQGRDSGPAWTLQEELTALGVPCEVIDGRTEWNRDGETRVRTVVQAATLGKTLVAISEKFSMDPRNAAGHEAFHFWGGTRARQEFEELLRNNLIFTSEAFQDYQDTIAQNYFGEDIDISDENALGRLMEEVSAYIAGDLHSGAHETELRSMFRDYDAVKAAWEALAEHGRRQAADGLGAADAGTVNTNFDEMQAKTDQFHPINEAAEARIREERGRAPSEVPVENPITGKNVGKTVSTILNSPLTSNEMAPILENAIAKGRFDYTPVTDRAAMEYAQSEIARRGGYQAAAQHFITLAELGQRITKDDFAVAAAAYSEANAAGDIATVFALTDAMSQTAHDSAQALQAVNLLNRLTPTGKLLSLRRFAERMNTRQNRRRGRQRTNAASMDLEGQRADYVEKRTGFTISDELAADYLLAETEEARAGAWNAIVQDLADQMPPTLLERWDAWRYLSMLTNPTTHLRNIAGNFVFGQLQRRMKNLLGTGLEHAFVRDRGQRTKSVLTRRDRGLREFARQQYEQDQSAAMGQRKYQEGGGGAIEQEIRAHRNILPGPLQWVSDRNSAALDREDLFFNRPVYVDSFAQALKAKGVTAEEAASGQKAELVNEARAYAVKEARKATFRDANAFSEWVSSIGRSGDKSNFFANMSSAAADIALPFRRTPANVLVRGVEYSPAGLVKALTYDAVQVRQGKMTAEEMIDHLASGLTGSGVFALGAFLAAQGLLHLRPGGDDRERNFLKDMGFQDFALQIGDHSYTLGWLSPSAMALFAGAAMKEASGEENTGGLEAFLSAMMGVTDSLLETSMLSSVNELLEGIGYAESKPWYILSSILMDFLSQGVPTVVGRTASFLDSNVRAAYVPGGKTEQAEDIGFFLQGIQRKMPVARNAMQPKIDLWGREVSNGDAGERFLESFLSPGYYSRLSDDALTKELRRLSEATGSSGVYPGKVPKSFMVGDVTKYLTAEEYTQYARQAGQARRKVVEQLMNSEGYQKLSDEGKAKAIAAAYEYADGVGKMAVSSWQPSDSHILKGAMKSALPPASYILYRQNADRDGSGSVSGAESALTLMDLPGMSGRERGEAWAQFNSRTSEVKNPFTGALSREGFDPEEALKFWQIYDGKGTKQDPYTKEEKQADVMEALGLSRMETISLWNLMEKSLK